MQIFIVPLVKIMKDFSNVSFLGYSIIHFYVLDRVGECEKVLLCHLSSRRRTFQSLPLPKHSSDSCSVFCSSVCNPAFSEIAPCAFGFLLLCTFQLTAEPSSSYPRHQQLTADQSCLLGSVIPLSVFLLFL